MAVRWSPMGWIEIRHSEPIIIIWISNLRGSDTIPHPNQALRQVFVQPLAPQDSNNSTIPTNVLSKRTARKKRSKGPKKESKVSKYSSWFKGSTVILPKRTTVFLYLSEITTSWWLNQPLWKTLVKMGSSSPNGGENKEYLKLPPRFIIFQGLCQSTFRLVNNVLLFTVFFNGTLSWLKAFIADCSRDDQLVLSGILHTTSLHSNRIC